LSQSCEIGNSCGCGFKNTGASYPEVWEEFHKVINQKVDCDECNSHGHMQINGLRDHVKAGIGGDVFDKVTYRKFVEEINCVFNKCSIDGRC